MYAGAQDEQHEQGDGAGGAEQQVVVTEEWQGGSGE
jgi:hypothetical protein